MSKVKSQKSKVKIIFIGTPKFGAIILEELIKNGYKPVLIITAPDKPVGRKQIITLPPVKLVTEKYNIPLEQPEKIENCKLKIVNCKPDLIVVAAYGQILPKGILNIPKYGCLNVHPSLLPKYRGPSPIQTTILNGDKESGVSIFLVTEKMDRGPIIAASKFKIQNSKITSGELLKELAEKGAELLLKTIPKWIKGKIKPKAQDESKASYTKILKKEDGKIDWQKSAEEIERQVRAFEDWPGSYFLWEKGEKFQRIEVLRARVLKTIDTNYALGKTLVAPQNDLCIQTGKGFLIVEKLQLEGKREMVSEDFLRGHPDFIGTILK